ncbi:MAG TPA: hypothetical protein VMW46_09725 [Candidatus Desulfaltia sp.]|nr:hypothetical protein [Candidatus Desulfaltia sp.]
MPETRQASPYGKNRGSRRIRRGCLSGYQDFLIGQVRWRRSLRDKGQLDVVDRIIDHIKLTFVADKPPPSPVFEQVALMAAEEPAEYFS